MSDADWKSALRRIAWPGLLALLVLLAFGRSVHHEFLEGDDEFMVLNQPGVAQPTLQQVGHFWTQPTLGLYTPLAYTLWAAVSPLAQQPGQDPPLNPAIFHGLNVLLHVIAAVVAFDLLRVLLRATLGDERPSYPAAAFVGAAIFALHPLQVEAIAWVAGMNNLLAGVFVLAAIDAHVRFVQAGRKRWATAAACLFIAALLSKPTAIVAPLMVFTIDALLLQRRWRSMLIELAVAGAIALPFVIVGRWAQPADAIIPPPLAHRLAIVGDTLGFYTWKFVYPWPLIANYGRTPDKVLKTHGDWPVWISLAGVSAVTIVGAWRWRRARSIVGQAVVAGSAIAVAGVILVSGIVPFDFQHYSTVADRYAYLSMLGPAVVGAFAVVAALTPSSPEARSRKGITATLSFLLVATFAWLSFYNIGWWKSTEIEWDFCLRFNPDNAMALNALGNYDKRRGNLKAAESHYRQALAFAPDEGVVYYNYGNLLMARDPAAAVDLYKQAIDNHFDGPEVHDNLAVALAKTGRLDESADVARTVLSHDPENVNALISLANVLAMRGDYGNALQLFHEALRLDPGSANAAYGIRQLEGPR